MGQILGEKVTFTKRNLSFSIILYLFLCNFFCYLSSRMPLFDVFKQCYRYIKHTSLSIHLLTKWPATMASKHIINQKIKSLHFWLVGCIKASKQCHVNIGICAFSLFLGESHCFKSFFRHFVRCHSKHCCFCKLATNRPSSDRSLFPVYDASY